MRRLVAGALALSLLLCATPNFRRPLVRFRREIP